MNDEVYLYPKSLHPSFSWKERFEALRDRGVSTNFMINLLRRERLEEEREKERMLSEGNLYNEI